MGVVSGTGLLDTEVDIDLDEMLGIPPAVEEAAPVNLLVGKRRRTVVCKHWLRGLCKRGDECDFLHVYDPSRMPECLFFVHYGECTNKDCIFLHTRPDEKSNECPWYARGFCKHGAMCRNRHTRRKVCPHYLQGFCPMGPKCQLAHPKLLVGLATRVNASFQSANPVTPAANEMQQYSSQNTGGVDLSNVTCFKCRKQGHYADKCPWGNI